MRFLRRQRLWQQKGWQWVALFSVVLGLFLWLGSCSIPIVSPTVLNVATASILRDAMGDVAKLYSEKFPTAAVVPVISGDRVLRLRIEAGDPLDVVILASPQSMDSLERGGYLRPNSRQELVRTRMALITRADSSLSLSQFTDLASDRVKKVALSLEGTGVSTYTKEILENFNLLAAIQSKALLTTVDVREIRHAVEQRAADVGITYLSEAQLVPRFKVVAIAPENSHRPVEVTVAALQNTQHEALEKRPHEQAVQKFIQFLKSPEVTALLQRHGFEAR